MRISDWFRRVLFRSPVHLPPLPLYTSDVGWVGERHPVGWSGEIARLQAELEYLVVGTVIEPTRAVPVADLITAADWHIGGLAGVVYRPHRARQEEQHIHWAIGLRAYVPPLSHSAPPLYTSALYRPGLVTAIGNPQARTGQIGRAHV